MYQNFKIVVNTAAGRRRYMQYLIPYIVSSDIVDRYDIWVNTVNMEDIEFFKLMAAKYSVINLVWQPDGLVNGNKSINAFYKMCVEPDTIYFKLDDDVVWMEPGLIEKMVAFRVENQDCFLVSPLVINNSISTYFLQVAGKLKLDGYYNADCGHPILWRSGKFALELHNWFTEKYLKRSRWEQLHIGKRMMGATRFSINAILWFGYEMAKFNGIVPGDDEEFMSCIYPSSIGAANAINGDAIVAHFAFFPQREMLDKGFILEKYGEISHAQWRCNPAMSSIDAEIQTVMKDITERKNEIQLIPCPYTRAPKKKMTMTQKLGLLFPTTWRDARNVAKSWKEKDNVILD